MSRVLPCGDEEWAADGLDEVLARLVHLPRCRAAPTEPARSPSRDPGLRRSVGGSTEALGRAQRRRSRRRERAAGKSKAEIAEIYVSELRARGLKVPAEPVLDAIVDRLCGNPLPAARVLGESLAQMGKGLHELSRIFRQGP